MFLGREQKGSILTKALPSIHSKMLSVGPGGNLPDCDSCSAAKAETM